LSNVASCWYTWKNAVFRVCNELILGGGMEVKWSIGRHTSVTAKMKIQVSRRHWSDHYGSQYFKSWCWVISGIVCYYRYAYNLYWLLHFLSYCSVMIFEFHNLLKSIFLHYFHSKINRKVRRRNSLKFYCQGSSWNEISNLISVSSTVWRNSKKQIC
jgi:uncharacterized membrane protein